MRFRFFPPKKPYTWPADYTKGRPILEDLWYSDIDLQVYCSHLDLLRKDFEPRFKDLVELVIPEWLQSPFLCARKLD